MLGEPFFELGRGLVEADSFERVAKLLTHDFRKQLPVADVTLVELNGDTHPLKIVGMGQQVRRLQEQPDRLDGCLSECNSGVCKTGAYEACAVRHLMKSRVAMGATDLIGICVMRGRFRSACLLAWKSEGEFTPREIERFQTAGMLAQCSLSRILTHRFDGRVLEHLMRTRKSAAIAVFVVVGDKISPYNPGAVSYAEANWGKDDVDFTLSEAALQAFWSGLENSWTSPVDPHWVPVEVDLGGGPMQTWAIVRPDNVSAVLIFPIASRQAAAPTGEVPMLTRRQCDIMDWIAEGKTSAEVAMILEISPRTVEKHLEAIFQRFGVENRVAAVRSYLEAKGGLPVN
jgi:DNA-binding CsgD family transcriptional regulator